MLNPLNLNGVILSIFLLPALGFGMESAPDLNIVKDRSFSSPHGKYIAITHEGYFEIRDKKTRKTVCYWPVPGERSIFLAWSPAGKRIAFSGDKENALGVWILDIPHQKTVQIAEGSCYKPTWSKSSGQLSYMYFDGREHEIFSIDSNSIETAFSRVLPSERSQVKLQPCDVKLMSFPPRIKSFQKGARLNKHIVLKHPPAYTIIPNGIQPGIRYHSDRYYVLKDIPDVFAGLPLLQSARSHDQNTQNKYSIVCSVPVPTLVFVAIDERSLAYWIFMGIIPDWIKEYTVTPYRILGDD
ncbi:hypothetical protein GF373_16210, partial [bacterium]|nr:hypothetical protein [bacterium]